MKHVDFGPYHHSTPEESKPIREYAEEAQSRIILDHKHGKDGRLRSFACLLTFFRALAHV